MKQMMHGAAIMALHFLSNKNNPDNPKVIVDWGFNAWGGDNDHLLKMTMLYQQELEQNFNLPVFHIQVIIMEGRVRSNLMEKRR